MTLCVTISFQAIRVFFPLVFDLGERGGTTSDAIRAGVLALTVFMSPPLTAALFRGVPPRWGLFASVGLLVAGRCALQVVHPVPLWLASLATATALVALTALVVVTRAGDSRGGRVFVLGLFLGMALDAGLRAMYWSWDYAWQGGTIPLLSTTVLCAGALVLADAGRDAAPIARGEATMRDVLPLGSLGPFLFLQVLVLQSAAFVASQSGMGLAGAEAVVLAGDSVALLVVAMTAGRRVPGGLAGAATVALVGLSLVGRGAEGPWAASAVIAAQAPAALLLTLAFTRPSPAVHGSTWRTSTAIGLGTLSMMLLLALYQIHYRLPLPFSNAFLIPAAALLLALGGLGGHGALEGPALRRERALVLWPLALMVIPLSLSLTSSAPTPTTGDGVGLRVGTYNVHLAIGSRSQLDPEAIAKTIDAAGLDVVGLQEVPRGWVGAGTMDLAEWLSHRLGMRYALAPAADRQFVNAVFSRLPLHGASGSKLPRVNGSQDRSYVRAQVDLGGGRLLSVLDAHLEGDSPDQRLQIERILDAWGGAPRTLIVGDLNMQPDNPNRRLFADAGMVSAQDVTGHEADSSSAHPNFPGDRPDWIFGSPDLSFSGFSIVRSTGSDHLPVTVRASTR